MRAPRTRVQRIVIAASAVILSAYVASGFVRRLAHTRQDQEFRGAPAAFGVATVLSVTSDAASQPGGPPRAWALVRFRGRVYTARRAVDAELLRPGSQARIVFRTGKSGQIAVDRVEPMSVLPEESSR